MAQVIRRPRLEIVADPTPAPAPPVDRESPLSRYRCANCGYGASCRRVPERCPMCGLTAWEHEEWRPFSRFGLDFGGDAP